MQCHFRSSHLQEVINEIKAILTHKKSPKRVRIYSQLLKIPALIFTLDIQVTVCPH